MKNNFPVQCKKLYWKVWVLFFKKEKKTLENTYKFVLKTKYFQNKFSKKYFLIKKLLNIFLNLKTYFQEQFPKKLLKSY